MKLNFKKALMVVSAFFLSFSLLALSTPVKAAEDEAVAYLSYADAEWVSQYWMDGNDYSPVVATNVPVTDYGTYTVSLDFTGTELGYASGMAFFDVEISNGEALFPNSYMAIDSVKINGEEVEVGKTYTSSDDDIATRTNLYNEWVAEVEEGRTADGDSTDVSPTPIDNSLYSEVKTVEVTFTLSEGVAFGGGMVEAKELPAEGTTAYISIADNSWTYQYWFDGNDYSPVVANNAMVTGYGEYTVSLDFTGVDVGSLPDIVFFDVEIDDGELYFPNNYMEINSVKINGSEIEVGNTYTNSDNLEDTRVNLFNSWVGEPDGRTNGLDISEVSAVPVDGTLYTNIETVEVTFTLIEGEAVVAEEEEYVFPESYNAFMMFSDVSGAWAKYEPGTSGDTAVIGDGTYTVYLTADEVGATGPATEGQVFLVDIEGLGEAMVHLGTLSEADDESLTVTDATASIKVWVDGEEVSANNNNILIGDIEGNGRLRLEFYNAWGTGTQDVPVVQPDVLTPESEIKVEFTLTGTGLNTGAVEEDSADDMTDDEMTDEVVSEESGSNTGLIGGVAAAVILIIVAVVVVLNKKKK